MKQVTVDDALIGLMSAVILQAVEDYQALQRRGFITARGEVVAHKSLGRIGKTTSYRHVDGIRGSGEVQEILNFFKGWQLDFLCEVARIPACRIRRKLGIRKEEV